MTDIEYVFNQTNRERKIAGRGDFHKKRGGGRYVRMPSDNMTRKEKSAMNGEVKTYAMGEPIGWREFKQMPRDIQQEYLDGITARFPHVSAVLIAEMLGTQQSTFSPYTYHRKLTVNNEGKVTRNTYLKSDEGKEWTRWSKKADVDDDFEDIEGIYTYVNDADGNPVWTRVDRSYVGAAIPEEKPEEKPEVKPETSKKDSIDINNIAVLLKALAGSGAKLTIEISL